MRRLVAAFDLGSEVMKKEGTVKRIVAGSGIEATSNVVPLPGGLPNLLRHSVKRAV